MEQQRRLAAILFTDIVGYTALMQTDEVQAMTIIKRYHSTLKTIVTNYSGEIMNDYGDGSLCSFPSAIQAVTASLELQKRFNEDPVVPLRIGLHVGEIFLEDGKVFGDGVNVASRIQSLGEANTILLSGEIKSKISNRPEFSSVSLGKFEFKNVNDPIEVFALSTPGLTIPKKERMKGKLKEKRKTFLGKRLLPIVGIVSLLIIVTFIYNRYFQQKSKFTGHEKSIAVLPFTNMSDDKANEYFSDGMTEEITMQLSKILDLKVIAISSAMLFKNSTKSIKEIAEELDVSAILKGSVQKDGNKVRIMSQLIDANSQEHIWADKYDRDLQDIFSIQSEVAQEIAFQLNAKLTESEKRIIQQVPTRSAEAYQLYLQGNQLHKTFIATAFKLNFFEDSRAMFEKAISLDPKFALAHAALADLYNTYTTYVNKDSLFSIQQIKLIEKAWELDSTNDNILNARGIIESSERGDIEKGFQYSKKALEINPNNPRTLLNLLLIMGDQIGLFDESKLLAERLVKVDPLSAVSFKVRGHTHFLLNQPEQAANDLETALRLQPDMINSMDQLAAVYAELGKRDDSKKLIERSLKERPELSEHNRFNLAYAYAKLGNEQKALELMPEQFVILLALGKNKEAIKALPDSDASQQTIYTPYLIYNSYLNTKSFDPIRNDPVFIRLLEQYKVKYEENKRKYSVMYLLN